MLATTGAAALVAGFMVMGTAGAAQANHQDGAHDNNTSDFKVPICHATGSESNPYENGIGEIPKWQITDPNGHGVVDHANHGDDIIPAFAAGSHGNQTWTDFAGLNTHLLPVLENGCEPLPATPTPTPTPVDVCPNLEGVQEEVPDGLVVDDEGNCVTQPTPVDVCPNLDGVQEEVPDGYTLVGGSCQPDEVLPTEAEDVCPNIPGAQGSVPDGLVLEDDKCVAPADQPTDEPTDEVLGTATAVPTAVDAGLGGPLPTSLSTADLVGKSLVGGGLVLLMMAALVQAGRLEHGAHQA